MPATDDNATDDNATDDNKLEYEKTIKKIVPQWSFGIDLFGRFVPFLPSNFIQEIALKNKVQYSATIIFFYDSIKLAYFFDDCIKL